MSATAEELNQRGNTAVQNGQYSEAIELYTKAIKKEKTAKYFSNRSAAYGHLQKWPQSYNDATQAVLLDPMWIKGYTRQGTALIHSGNCAAALNVYQSALKLSPDDNAIKAAIAECNAALKKKEYDPDTCDDFFQRSAVEEVEKLAKTFSKQDFARLTQRERTYLQALLSVDALVDEGTRVMNGDGRERNSNRAKEIFNHAAAKGHPGAMFQLATLLCSEGTLSSYQESLTWLHRAVQEPLWRIPNKLANVGVAMAMHGLGVAYRDGLGCEVDLDKAISWFEKAAESGHHCMGQITALHNLAVAYIKGQGVPEDPSKALQYSLRAAEFGFPAAHYLAAGLYMRGEGGLPVDMAKAKAHLEKSAAQGHAASVQLLSQFSTRPSEVFAMLRKAAETGTPAAKFHLGVSYMRGTDGASLDRGEGKRLIAEAAKAGDLEAAVTMGNIYKGGSVWPGGEPFPVDLKKAYAYYHSAADKGHEDAEFKVGLMLLEGEGVEKDQKQGEHWIQRAARHGCKEAEAWLNGEYTFCKPKETLEKEMAQWEDEQGLSREGLSREERIKRYGSANSEDAAEQLAADIQKRHQEKNPPGKPTPYSFSERTITIEELAKFAVTSETAKRLLEAKIKWEDGLRHCAANRYEQAITLMGEALFIEPSIGAVNEVYSECVAAAIKTVMKNDPNNALAIYVFLRIQCMGQGPEFLLANIVRCIRLDQSQVEYRSYHAWILRLMGQHRESAQVIDEALRSSPERWDLLWMKGAALCNVHTREADIESIVVLRKFLASAPKDAKQRPDACYIISVIYGMALDNWKEAVVWYHAGLDAEKDRLPFFPSLQRNPNRKQLDAIIPLKMKHCTVCGASKSVLDSRGCGVWVCRTGKCPALHVKRCSSCA